MLSKIESRHWMYLVGWFTPLIVVLISASYGLSNDVYIKPRTKEEELVCGEGQLLYPPFNESTNSKLIDILLFVTAACPMRSNFEHYNFENVSSGLILKLWR